MGKRFIIQAAQVPLKNQIKPFPSDLKAVRSCSKPSTQQSPWNRLLAFVILPLLQNKPSIHVFHCRATKQKMEMPKKVILCISSPSRFTQLLWKILTGGLNKTSHVLSFFHQRLTKDNLVFFCIPPAMPLLGKAAAEAFLSAIVIPSISGWLKWAAGVGRQIDQTALMPCKPTTPSFQANQDYQGFLTAEPWPVGVTKIKLQGKLEKKKRKKKRHGGKITWILNTFQTLLLAPSLVLNPSFGQTMAMRSEPGIQCPLITKRTDACRELLVGCLDGMGNGFTEVSLVVVPCFFMGFLLPCPCCSGGTPARWLTEVLPHVYCSKPPHRELLAVRSLVFPRTPQRANFKWTKALEGREKGRGRRVSWGRKEMAEIASFLFPLSCPR